MHSRKLGASFAFVSRKELEGSSYLVLLNFNLNQKDTKIISVYYIKNWLKINIHDTHITAFIKNKNRDEKLEYFSEEASHIWPGFIDG